MFGYIHFPINHKSCQKSAMWMKRNDVINDWNFISEMFKVGSRWDINEMAVPILKPLTKVYITVIVGACVVLYQYHLYSTWSSDIINRAEVRQDLEADHNFNSRNKDHINIHRMLSELQSQRDVFAMEDVAWLWDRIRIELNTQYQLQHPVFVSILYFTLYLRI